MAEFRLPRLPETDEIVETNRRPTFKFQRWWQSVVKKIETQEATQDELLAQILAAQAAAAAAQAAADAAQVAADAAQDAADAAQAAIDALPPSGSRTVSANDDITESDYTILADASGGAITLTLPLAAAVAGPFVVKKIDATANAVNIARSGSDQINGTAGPIAITTAYEQRSVASDGIDSWYVS